MANPLGPPTAAAYVGLLEVFVGMGVGALNKTCIRQELGRFENLDKPEEDVNDKVQVCKLCKTARPEKTGLVITLKDVPCRRAVVDALVQGGAAHTGGAAPPAYMEEVLQEWVRALAGTIKRGRAAHTR